MASDAVRHPKSRWIDPLNYAYIAEGMIQQLLVILDSAPVSRPLQKNSPGWTELIRSPIQWGSLYHELAGLLNTTQDGALVTHRVASMIPRIRALPPFVRIKTALLLMGKKRVDEAIHLTRDVDPAPLPSANEFIYLASAMPTAARQREYLLKINKRCAVTHPEKGLIQIATRLGFFDLASHWIEQVESTSNTYANFLKDKFFVLIGMWRNAEALATIRQEGPSARTPLSHLFEGVALWRRGRADKAIEILDPLVDDPRCGWSAQFHKACSLRSLGDFEKAERIYSSILPSAKDWRAYFELSMTLVFRNRMTDAAKIAREGAQCISLESGNLCSLLSALLTSDWFPTSYDFVEQCARAMNECSMPFFHEYLAFPAYLGTRHAIGSGRHREFWLLNKLLERSFSVYPPSLTALLRSLDSLTAKNLPDFADRLSQALFPWHDRDQYERQYLRRLEMRLRSASEA